MARPLSREGALTALASLLLVQVVGCQHVKVEPEVLAYPGQDVTLRCQFVQDGEAKLTQVSWIWEPVNGQKQNIAVFHPNFGASYPSSPLKGRISFINSSLENPSIHITALVLGDEGKYTCEYATYPSGNDQGTTSLFVLVKPRSSADIITVPAGDSPVAVARCVAAGGRPAADVSWETAAQGNWTTVPTQNSDGTVTMTSEYLLAPTSEDNGKDISCVVKHKTLKIPARFPLKLFVEYPPQVKIFGYDNNWYIGRTEATLMCEATGNPSPTNVTWKLLSGQMPENVVISHNKLTVLKVDEAVNSTFVCEVNTRLGATREQISVNVRGTPVPMKGPATSSIIGGIIGVILVLAVIGSVIALVRRQRLRKECGDAPPTHKPPPPKKKGGSTEELHKSLNPLTESHQPWDRIYSERSAEPVTDLDVYNEEECLRPLEESPAHGDTHPIPEPQLEHGVVMSPAVYV
ncbi:nectin-2 isoform X2 [Lepisosteus oculatus]|uniref:nectin-2 isoform X2 n=1 Tax=Lepisosteus oculatus TaxID=7918 RepID=UPI003716271F